MVRRTVNVDGVPVLLGMDDQPPLGARYWAVVRARVTDELTGAPPAAAITVESDQPLASPRVATDGLVGLVAEPRQVFPALASQSYDVTLRVGAPGYAAREGVITVPQDFTFPATFAPPPLVDLPLHRTPTVIYGRTVLAAAGATTPVAGATVSLMGLWRTVPPANAVVPPSAPDIISLTPPLYAARTSVAGPNQGRLQTLTLTTVVGSDRALLSDALAGTDRVLVSNRGTLAPGDILHIDANDPDRSEYVEIAVVTGITGPSGPALVTLAHRLRQGHRRDALVQVVTAGAPAQDKALAVDALPGDGSVFPANLTGIAASETARVTGGPLPDEYHRVRRFTTVSDADGYYRLPPITRVARVRLRAERLGLTTVETEYQPEYASGAERVDFTFV